MIFYLDTGLIIHTFALSIQTYLMVAVDTNE